MLYCTCRKSTDKGTRVALTTISTDIHPSLITTEVHVASSDSWNDDECSFDLIPCVHMCMHGLTHGIPSHVLTQCCEIVSL